MYEVLHNMIFTFRHWHISICLSAFILKHSINSGSKLRVVGGVFANNKGFFYASPFRRLCAVLWSPHFERRLHEKGLLFVLPFNHNSVFYTKNILQKYEWFFSLSFMMHSFKEMINQQEQFLFKREVYSFLAVLDGKPSSWLQYGKLRKT